MTQRAVLLEALASTPADVAWLARGLDEAAARWRPAGGPSCRDLLAQLLHREAHYRRHFERILSEDAPQLAILAAEPAPPSGGPLVALAEQFALARAGTLALLGSLTAGQWQRPAVHPRDGRTTLRSVVQELLAADIDATSRLAALRAQARAATAPAGPA